MIPQLKKDVAALDAVRDQAHARRLVKRARYKRVNDRRCDLIVAGQTKDNPEYAELKRIVTKIVNLAFPPPKINQRITEVLARLRAKGINVDASQT
jgi:hypothetical protein